MARQQKSTRRRDENQDGRKQNNLVDIKDARNNMFERQRKQNVTIIPRNTKQEEYLSYLADDSKKIVVACGSAGTGKTLIAVTKAIQDLQTRKVQRIVITRPAVSVANENHGFLPGTIEQKMEPWLLPIFDIFEEYFSKFEIQRMMEEGVIEIAPLMYMRGRNFKDSCIIFDEAQNSTPDQMQMLLTRLCENTKVYVTGDLDQTDHQKTNGLLDLCRRIKPDTEGLVVCKFDKRHIERSRIVQIIVGLYEE